MFWRVVYDKVPPPRPNHFPGKDIVSIHEDSQGNGCLRQAHRFSRRPQHRHVGGPWPWRCLWCSIRRICCTIRPKTMPIGRRVILSSTSKVCWRTRIPRQQPAMGPDGWLYRRARQHGLRQHYPPGDKAPIARMVGQAHLALSPREKSSRSSRRGGGNAFGIEIDSLGRVYSRPQRRRHPRLHYVQGGAYRKGFEKHGVLAIPTASVSSRR